MISFVRNLDALNQKLLSFITATRPLGSSLHKGAYELRKSLTDLYFCIYYQVIKVQDTLLNDRRLDELRVAHPENLTLHYPYDHTRVRTFDRCIASLSAALDHIYEVLLFFCVYLSTEGCGVSFQCPCLKMLLRKTTSRCSSNPPQIYVIQIFQTRYPITLYQM